MHSSTRSFHGVNMDIIEDFRDELNREKIRETVTSKYFLGLLLIAGVALYLRLANSFFTGLWVDEARYAQIGKEVSTHLLSYSSFAPQWKLQIQEFPPVFPYLIAVMNYFFSSETAARLVSPVVSTFGVFVGYLLGRDMKNRTTGLMIAALLAVNPVFWFLSTRVLIGATLTVIYTVAVYLLFYGMDNRKYSKYAIWLLGPVVALSLMTKQPAYTLGLVIPIYFFYRKSDELKQVLFTDTSFMESDLKETLTERKYYVSAGLALLVLLPWMLRNFAVCGFAFCGVKRALEFAVTGGLDVHGDFFFIKNMPTVLSLPVTILVGASVVKYAAERAKENPDFLVKYFVATGIGVFAAYMVRPDLIPMITLMSVAALTKDDAQKLLWLWIGAGIGFMSIPGTKVPRYIVFTVPALVAVAAFIVYDASSWIAEALDFEQFGTQEIALLAVLPFVAFSFLQGTGMVTGHSFQHVESTGTWLAENTPEDTRIAASSAVQVQYFAYPRVAKMPRVNRTQFDDFLIEENITYLEVDIYERTQPEWLMTDIPPYKLPNSLIRQIRSGQVSPQQAASRFKSPPSYLTPVKSFGRTQMPLVRNRTQPMAMIYRINRSALQ
ncbi:MAG: ArnT family glycosyltransferase [Candidatus Nanohaloarchaea archaeon]